MKKFLCMFLTLSIACSCLLLSGCNMGRNLYRGDKSLISNVSIIYPYLDCTAYLNAEDQNTFIKYLEKTKLIKIEKPAVFNMRPAPDNYFAYVNVHGNTSEARSVKFYVFIDGKIQVNGQLVESWYDGQLNNQSMDIILKYQGDNFKPAENLQYYNNGTAKKITDNNSQPESKTYFTSHKPEEAILLKFLGGLTSFSSNQMPKQQIVDGIGQILPTNTVDETYAFTFNFKTDVTRPAHKSYFCGIVASSNMVRIIVEQKVKIQTKYILTDYEMDGSAIRDSIKALVDAAN